MTVDELEALRPGETIREGIVEVTRAKDGRWRFEHLKRQQAWFTVDPQRAIDTADKWNWQADCARAVAAEWH